jgi:hypothetical protein
MMPGQRSRGYHHHTFGRTPDRRRRTIGFSFAQSNMTVELVADAFGEGGWSVPFSIASRSWVEFVKLAVALARISHSKKCIGAPNQRKFFCDKDFPQIRGRPDDDRL